VCARRQRAKAHILRDSEQEERQASPSPVGNVIASKAAAEEHTALLARLKQDLVVLQGVYEQRCAVSRTQYCDRTISTPRTTLHSRHHVSMCVYLLGSFSSDMASTIQNLEEQVRNSQGELADLMIVGDEVRLHVYTFINGGVGTEWFVCVG
jgi:hypothetical protein